MSLQQIGQQFRSTREKMWSLAADAMQDITNSFKNTYEDMGWFKIDSRSSGIKKDMLVSPQFNIVTANGKTVAARLYSENRQVFIELVDVRTLTIKDIIQSIQSADVLISSGEIAIMSRSTPSIRLAGITGSHDSGTGDYSGNITVIGGVTAGIKASISLDVTKSLADSLSTFVDAVDGDSTALQNVNLGGVNLSYTKGADNAVTVTVDKLAVVVTVKDITHSTTVKPASVATSRLGIGASVPSTDGHAVVNTYLGAAAPSPSATEKFRVGGDARVDSNLGIGMNPTRPLDVTGNGKVTGTWESGGNTTVGGTLTITPLAAGDVLLAQSGGVVTTISPGTARFALDVYSKSETDAAIAAAISAIVIDAVPDHTHGGGGVDPAGGHSHTHS